MNAIAINELEALKGRQMVAWASGDYAVIGTTLQIVGEKLAEADIAELLSRMNLDGRVSLTVPSEYLEVVITRR
jgi:hypothetical protein